LSLIKYLLKVYDPKNQQDLFETNLKGIASIPNKIIFSFVSYTLLKAFTAANKISGVTGNSSRGCSLRA
jgi:hypothetical protein